MFNLLTGLFKRETKLHAVHGSSTYDAVNNRSRRRQNMIDTRREDDILHPRDRDRLISEARILRRNAPDFAWMIRKHLDYVSTFEFQCRTGYPELDDKIEALMYWRSRPQNCDVAGRHSLQRLIRLLESCATTDGDAFVMKLSDGRIQLIEGDRVRNPQDFGDFKGNFKPEDFTHGVQTTGTGKALRYAICDRDKNRFVLRFVIPSQYVLQHGAFDRNDQIRGVSRLAAAINVFCDTYEAQEYALAKAKLSQYFALALKRGVEGDPEEAAEPITFDFGKGPQVIQLDPSDSAEFLESHTPSTEFQAFIRMGIERGLKALDIPYSFFAENYSNYSGARQALLQYEQSCKSKREDLLLVLNDLTEWWISLWVADGLITLPDGVKVTDLDFEWIPVGLPWIDPLREANADIARITNKLASRQQIAKEHGQDWFIICDQLSEEEQYMTSKQLTVDTGAAASAANAVTIQQQIEDLQTQIDNGASNGN